MASGLKLIVLLGLVSLFADFAYEGARSITGPFMFSLGASAVVVGIVAGLGEGLGYGLRVLSGYLCDRTRNYWFLTAIGYAVNLIAVPTLALAGNWQIAALLIIVERIGKAIRNPSRDVILSHAASQDGRSRHGFGFGLHSAIDQVGAIVGPLFVAFLMLLDKGYRTSFALLFIPALFSFCLLGVAWKRSKPIPVEDQKSQFPLRAEVFPKAFWFYLIASSLMAVGYADFMLIAFHLKNQAIVKDGWIPLFYSLAMGVDAFSGLFFGSLFDRKGIPILITTVFFASFAAPFAFLGDFRLAIFGVALWGLGLGAHESILRAMISRLVPLHKRGFAFGLFNAAYGFSWFLGSALMGILYQTSIVYLVVFSISAQLISIPILLLANRNFILNKGS